MMQTTRLPYIMTNKEILSGEPIVGGTRTPVWAIVELSRGFTAVTTREAGQRESSGAGQLAYHCRRNAKSDPLHLNQAVVAGRYGRSNKPATTSLKPGRISGIASVSPRANSSTLVGK